MEIDYVRTVIKQLILKKAECPEFKDDIDLFSTGLNLNSIQYIELVVEIETKFGIKFDNKDLLIDAFNNVGELVRYVFSKVELKHKQE
ncbi:phosphopantetheine binding protein [Anaerobacterium chartisolvens]|uniref:Phosphopantetheine binding protein n=2 Tax=Anaerobacterium chartisolvens TaxID=1297424 RepID=A0A369AVX7_9FIRM|nr:phosphopantetheine binding protein [Anaerobacterium chartisolvens]